MILLLFVGLTGCASLKPIEKSFQEVPRELPPEIQSKFQVEENSLVVLPKVEEVKPVVKPKTTPVKKVATPKVEAKLVPGPVVTLPVEKQFKPPIGQRLIFAVYALGLRAGTLITKVEGVKTINGQEVVLLKANVYNAAFFASIFTVNLLVESYVDPVDFKSVRYQITGQEGPVQKQDLELYDYELGQIIEHKTSTKDGKKSTSQKTSPGLDHPAQDLLSSFWKVVSLDFSKNKEQTFLVASSDKVKVAKVVKLSDYEDGYVLGLSFEEGQDPADRKIFLNTKTKLVDKIEANIRWGKFKVIRVEEE